MPCRNENHHPLKILQLVLLNQIPPDPQQSFSQKGDDLIRLALLYQGA